MDLEAVIQQMLGAMVHSLREDAAALGSYGQQILAGERAALQQLAEQRLRGEITDEELQMELEDERLTIEAQMLAVSVMSKAAVQRASQAATAAFFNAVKALI
ncbi:hypothetical protein [Bowmanella sp. JS7-9]|uniref:Uncharacterized protein n=1 Tax=Pseudobowmanella zhangzhouensis TaxID=1537679 RepID=A0ABW1XJU6_9ALTE|nr:hypothetical protein [Bowmanella sp. JS7-9]